MIILIVGPSGVGKTTTYQVAESHFPDVVFRNLDGLAARLALECELIDRECVSLLRRTMNDDSQFLAFGKEAINKLAGQNPGKHLIIDVGAGFQVAPAADKLHRIHTVIALTAEPSVAYKRIREARDDSRTFERYKNDEYSARRVAVYRSAQHKIDTSHQSEQETAEAFIALLHELIE